MFGYGLAARPGLWVGRGTGVGVADAGVPPDSGVADVLGAGGVYRDPLWRVTVALTGLEGDLLRCWWVRRLAFVAHAGASAISTTQTYSRLEHSLGLLALTARFAPGDRVARAAALLHDVGHLPLSHTFEHVAGLDHHQLGADRVQDLRGLLARHGVDAGEVLAVESGQRPSVLAGAPGVLKLDHLESLLRSARAHGRTRQPPPVTLARLAVTDQGVSTDADTGEYLAELVAGEARLHCSAVNAIPTGVVRSLAGVLLDAVPPERWAEVAAMTDDEFWVLLLTDPATAATARALRRDPAGWRTVEPAAGHDGDEGTIDFVVPRLYLDLPMVDGQPLPATHPALVGLPALPWRCTIVGPADTEAARI